MSDKKYFIHQNGKRLGPLAISDIEKMIAEGELAEAAKCWSQGQSDWKSVHEEFPSLVPPPIVNEAVRPSQPAPPKFPNDYGVEDDKSPNASDGEASADFQNTVPRIWGLTFLMLALGMGIMVISGEGGASAAAAVFAIFALKFLFPAKTAFFTWKGFFSSGGKEIGTFHKIASVGLTAFCCLGVFGAIAERAERTITPNPTDQVSLAEYRERDSNSGASEEMSRTAKEQTQSIVETSQQKLILGTWDVSKTVRASSEEGDVVVTMSGKTTYFPDRRSVGDFLVEMVMTSGDSAVPMKFEFAGSGKWKIEEGVLIEQSTEVSIEPADSFTLNLLYDFPGWREELFPETILMEEGHSPIVILSENEMILDDKEIGLVTLTRK